ncbi:MAG: beta strand repeat-containing protein [Ilumatobacteraceae bacterium]
MIAVVAAVLAIPSRVDAAKQWDGDAATGNFSDNANWYGNTQPTWSFADGNLEFNFSNGAQTSLFFDYSGWRTTADIFWISTFPKSMVLSSNGNGMDFTVRLENQSAFAQTVNMPLSGGKNGATEIQLNPVVANLTLNGEIYNDNSVDYVGYGSTGTMTTLTLNCAIGSNAPTQSNVDFTVAGGRNTLVSVGASQVWAGTTTVNSGSFAAGDDDGRRCERDAAAGGTVASTSANTFADSATITVNSGRFSIGGSDTVASLAGSGGSVQLAAGATLTTGNSGSTSYSGSITGAGNLTKVGSGTFTLTSANTFTGTARVTAGQLSLSGANLLADNAAVVVDGGVMSFGGNDTIGSLAGTGGTVAIGANTLTVSQSGNTTFAGALTGSGTRAKNGAGALNVSGNAAAFAGATQVQGGALAVDGSLGGTVDIALAAILSGTGTVGGNTSIAGTHVPGGSDAVGAQTFNGNLTYAAGSILNWELFANNAILASYDRISIPNGNLTFSGSASVAMSFNGTGSAVVWSHAFWNVSRSWLIQDLGTGVTNNFSNFSISTQNWLDSTGAAFNTVRPNATFSLSQQGQDVQITYVPEPAMTVSLLGGLAALARFASRRRGSC